MIQSLQICCQTLQIIFNIAFINRNECHIIHATIICQLIIPVHTLPVSVYWTRLLRSHIHRPCDHGLCNSIIGKADTEGNVVASGLTAQNLLDFFNHKRLTRYVIQPAVHQCSPVYLQSWHSWTLSKYVSDVIGKSSWLHLQSPASSTHCQPISWRTSSQNSFLHHRDVQYLTHKKRVAYRQSTPRYCPAMVKESNS